MPDKKLYKVVFTVTSYALGEHESDAIYHARGELNEVGLITDKRVDVEVVDANAQPEDDWGADSLVYGADGDLPLSRAIELHGRQHPQPASNSQAKLFHERSP